MITTKDIPSECIEYRNRERTLMFSEKGRSYYGLNPDSKEILGFKVDKGFINDENDRCDYSLIVQNDVCFLIELKGHDVSHSAEQIMSTREIFDKNYGIKKFVARIVCSKAKTTELNSNTFKKMKKVMKMLKKRQKQYGRPEHFVYINTHRPIEK
ncbi:MAG: hypothetical protein K2M99_02335, partial [Treponemataceae bacterium]|nr:hypothetical protein [Treponemataceae bacterium]